MTPDRVEAKGMAAAALWEAWVSDRFIREQESDARFRRQPATTEPISPYHQLSAARKQPAPTCLWTSTRFWIWVCYFDFGIFF